MKEYVLLMLLVAVVLSVLSIFSLIADPCAAWSNGYCNSDMRQPE